jgi:teichuronic acid biosynthesis glycosyltransferase TuaG
LSNKVDTLLRLNGQVNTNYICLLDIDDKWTPTKLEEQIKYIDKYDVIGTYAKYFGRSNNIPNLPSNDLKNFNFYKYNPIINSSVMLKKDLLIYNINDEIGEADRYSLEDYSLWLKLKKLNYKFFNIAKILTYHRIYNNSYFNNQTDQNLKINKIKDYYKLKI